MRNIQFYEGSDMALMYQKAANGVGNTLLVRDYRNISVTITAENSFAGVIKCQGARTEKSTINFSSAASLANPIFNVQMKETDDDDNIDGSTGITYGGASDGVRSFRLNTDQLSHINFIISSYTAGNITVEVILSDNQ